MSKRLTHEDLEGYDSSFEDEDDKPEVKKKKTELVEKQFKQPNATQASSAGMNSGVDYDQ